MDDVISDSGNRRWRRRSEHENTKNTSPAGSAGTTGAALTASAATPPEEPTTPVLLFKAQRRCRRRHRRRQYHAYHCRHQCHSVLPKHHRSAFRYCRPRRRSLRCHPRRPRRESHWYREHHCTEVKSAILAALPTGAASRPLPILARTLGLTIHRFCSAAAIATRSSPHYGATKAALIGVGRSAGILKCWSTGATICPVLPIGTICSAGAWFPRRHR